MYYNKIYLFLEVYFYEHIKSKSPFVPDASEAWKSLGILCVNIHDCNLTLYNKILY